MPKRREIHERVLNAVNKEELASAYSEWAETYDTDLVDEMGYVAPVLTCELLLEYLENVQAKILDAGCGTGLVGSYLYQHDYHNVEGFDYSSAMLKKAKAKSIYRDLYQGDLTTTLKLPDNHYTAIISVGTFTSGHVGPEAFEELIRITHPEGYLCFTVRDQAWEKDNYRSTLIDLEQKGLWKLVEERTMPYIQQEGSNCKICLYQKSICPSFEAK